MPYLPRRAPSLLLWMVMILESHTAVCHSKIKSVIIGAMT